MSTRRRRTGYRPGVLSDQLRRAIDAEAEAVAGVEGPIARIDGAADVLAAVENALEAVRTVRLEAITELRRQGWSYDRIAAASTMSKSRVKQLVVEAEQAGLIPIARHRHASNQRSEAAPE